jgi:nucleoside-diphosphate-sugar epimerase
MHGASRVIHLAAIVGDQACELDRKTAIEINYVATRMSLEVAKRCGIERFLFASSCSLYGSSDIFMDETSLVQPVSLYGETKLASERALLEVAGTEFHPVILRFATVFGLSNRPRFDLVVNLLSAKARQDRLITVFNEHQWRPFIHVKDISEAIILVLKAPSSTVSHEIFNVGDNRLNHTLAEVAGIIQRVFPNATVQKAENSDPRNYRINFSKIENRIGFRCHYHLEDGVREIKAAFDSGKIHNYKNGRFSNLVSLRKSGTPKLKSRFDLKVIAVFGGRPS